MPDPLIVFVTPEVVREALGALREPASLDGHVLAQMAVVRSRSGRRAAGEALAGLIRSIVESRLAERRARLCLTRPLAPSAAAEVAADFAPGDQILESWACVYHRFLAPDPWTVADLARVAKPTYDYADRHIRRRSARGYELLADALGQIEHAYGGEPPSPAALAGNGRTSQPLAVAGLPHPLTRFFGRTPEVAQVRAALREDRLVTLVGPGGVGKTHLAIAALSGLDGATFDRAWWLDLGVHETLAEGLDLPTQVYGLGLGSGASPTEGMWAGPLADGRGLLVADNCEHLLPRVADLLASALVACPGLTVLATSREPLWVPGERLVRVGPLPVPAGTDLPALAENVAVQLFVDRLRLVRPEFVLSADSTDDIVALCQALDGLPLALEMVAARAWVEDLHQMAAASHDVVGLTAGPRRGVASRHQSLSANMDWSIERLTVEEWALLRRLGRLAGSWDLDRALAVAAFAPVEADQVPVLLCALADRSLIWPTDSDGLWSMARALRDVCRGRLTDEVERVTCESRRLAWCRELVAEVSPVLRPGQAATWRRLKEVEPDIDAALVWAEGPHGDRPGGLELAIGLVDYWCLCGRAAGGRDRLQALLASAGPTVAPELEARALLGLAQLDRALGASALHSASWIQPVSAQDQA